MALLETRDLSKAFPGVLALDRVSLSAEGGEVRALVGANGAGKSTLMNLLAGVFRPTGGSIRLAGETVAFDSPRAARQAGISIVYQELSTIPELSVAENVVLGREPAGLHGLMDRDRLMAETEAVLDRFHLPLDAAAPVEGLSVAQCQQVEIARALSVSARVLILDEPTAVLSEREHRNLFDIIARLKAAGLLVLYVSHRLEEVFRIADRITVLRDGREVATVEAADTSSGELVHMMTGHGRREGLRPGPVAAEAADVLTVAGAGSDGSGTFAVRRGEIVGLAGLVGAGRTRLARQLAGLERARGLELRLDGQPLAARSAGEALRRGLVYLTEDRKRDGLFANLSVLHNATAGALARFTALGFLGRGRERSAAQGILERLRLVARSLDMPAGQLSGGNQQKLVFARALLGEPRVLVCDEPTRGVDVGAKDEIYEILIELASRGVAVLLISSEIEELLALSHRILVMRDGALVGELETDGADARAVLALASGAETSVSLARSQS